LRERLDRELLRNAPGQAVSTEALGGWSRLGARLDGVLRALFDTVCHERATHPAAAWHHATATPYDRATAGMIAHVLTTSWASVTATDPVAARLLVDLRDPSSAIRAAIACRNALVHDRPLPREGVEALRRLRALVEGLDSRLAGP